MKVAYYYNQDRYSRGDTRTNPYGPSLVEAMERLGIAVEFSLRMDLRWLLERRRQVQVLHLNWPSYLYKQSQRVESFWTIFRRWVAFIANLMLARLLGYKIVWTMHNLYPHNTRFRLLDHLGRLALCALCNAVIVHCEHARRLLARQFRRTRRVYVIPHGNFLDVYPNNISRVQARQQLGIPDSNFVYAFFGSIQPYKGVEDLIRTFSSLPGEDLSLIVAGSLYAPDARELLREAEHDPRIVVRTSNRTPSEELQVYHNAADVMVLPFSAMLTSGTVILALSWKKPIIVPILGCLPELMTGDIGIMYDPKDPDALCQAMLDIRQRDLKAMGERAHDRMLELSWERIAARTLQAYQES